ncbi:DUF3592 domain-containing protein [Streptomyces xylophagus]|uniref:DUF3592 domain-containing protein n=1 Tax=Streptomyces xylophagus TaxID=285514 RepID=UPI0005BC3759|nr:DUF3592 domain-containing protein [Streptomyces xylophagus]
MVAIWVWVPVSLILFGVSVVCGASAWEIYRLRRHGVRTTAQVSGFRSTKDADSDPRHHVLVIFCLPDGTEVEAQSLSSNPDGSNNFVRGDAMDIVYDPAKPTRIYVTRFEEHRVRTSDAVAYAIGAATAVLFAALTLAQAFTG